MSPGRLHALIDGVVAIAITLLVLDLPRPGRFCASRIGLIDEWPSYLAYFASFATVGIVWTEHTGMMSAVREVNRRVIERTLACLLFLSVIPWPTALAADYVRAGGGSARTAALLYGATMMLMGAAITMRWRYLRVHDGLVVEQARAGLPRGDASQPARNARLPARPPPCTCQRGCVTCTGRADRRLHCALPHRSPGSRP